MEGRIIEKDKAKVEKTLDELANVREFMDGEYNNEIEDTHKKINNILADEEVVKRTTDQSFKDLYKDIEYIKGLIDTLIISLSNGADLVDRWSKKEDIENDTSSVQINPGESTALNEELKGTRQALIDQLRRQGMPDSAITAIITSINSSVTQDGSADSYRKLIQKYKDTLKAYTKTKATDNPSKPKKKSTSDGGSTGNKDNQNDDDDYEQTLRDQQVQNSKDNDKRFQQQDDSGRIFHPFKFDGDDNTPTDTPTDPILDKPSDNPMVGPTNDNPVTPQPANNDTPSQPQAEPTPVTPQPASNTNYTPSQSYNNYSGGYSSSGNDDVEVLTPKEEDVTITPEVMDTIEKGNRYTKIPSSTIEKVTASNDSGNSSVIPILAGVSAAAAAGIGAKAYMDRKKNTDNTTTDIEASEWNEELEDDDDKYKASSNNELYVNNDNGLSDDYAYQEPEVEKYESRSNSELSDMQ